MKHIVEVMEVWVQSYEVDAEDPEEAKDLVHSGEGTLLEGEFEYSYMLDSETWTARKKE